VVSAAAGYGKTTLLSQWAASTAYPVAWVSLDADDADPLTLLRDLVAAIRQVDPALAQRTSLLLDRPALPVLTLVRSFLNDLTEVTSPLLIVLDDLHLIDSPEIQEAIAYLVMHLPKQVHLVLSSRRDPELPYYLLRAHGDIVEIRDDDLRFDIDETGTLLRSQYELDLTESELRAIDQHTEGWVACIHLLAHSTRHRLKRDILELLRAHREANLDASEFLWAEVIAGQSADVRSFLTQIAVLDTFSSDLCDAVTGLSNGKAMIRRLKEAHLFLVPLDDRNVWFRFHHMMTAALRAHLADELRPDEIEALHRRAAGWYDRAGHSEEATRHAIAGKDWDLATRNLLPLCRALYLHDRLKSLRSWLQHLPAEVLEREPELCYWYGWSLARIGEFRQALQPLAAAERAWEAAGDRENLAAIQTLSVLKDVVMVESEEAIGRASRTLAALPEHRVSERWVCHTMTGLAHSFAGRPVEAERELATLRSRYGSPPSLWLQLLEMNASGFSLLGQGKLADAATLFRRTIEIGDPWNHLPVQHASWMLASIEIERTHLDEAERLLVYADELAEQMAAILHGTVIHQYLAEIAWSRGQHERAFDEIERAIRFAADVEAHPYIATAKARRARFWLQQGQTVLAHRWAEEAGIDLHARPAYPRFFEYLTAVRLRLHEEDVDSALAALSLAEMDAIETGRTGDLIGILVLSALAQQKAGQRSAGVDTLGRALDLGLPLGFRRVFMNEGELIYQLIDRLSHNARHRGIGNLLRAAGSAHRPDTQADGAVPSERLSVREVEILQLVAAGEQNAAIADRLFISEGTVKKHVSNILIKLQAKNRTHAVELARNAGML
jgi:LuxR family maltose regulon positive regulatory protein